MFQEEQWQAVEYTYRQDELESLIYEMESMGIVTFNTVVVFRMYIIFIYTVDPERGLFGEIFPDVMVI
jgi:hypothetical protein